MHILILGGGGMVGRKLAERLARDGSLGGRAIDRLTLHDVVAPQAPAGAAFPVETLTSDFAAPGEAERLVAAAARRDLPPRGHRVRRGGGRFREGLPDQSRRHALPLRRDPHGAKATRRAWSSPPRSPSSARRSRRRSATSSS